MKQITLTILLLLTTFFTLFGDDTLESFDSSAIVYTITAHEADTLFVNTEKTTIQITI